MTFCRTPRALAESPGQNLRRVVSALALLALVMGAVGCSALGIGGRRLPDVQQVGAPSSTLFELPDRISVSGEEVRLSAALDPTRPREYHYLIAVPPDTNRVEITAIRLRHPVTREVFDLQTSPTLTTTDPTAAELRSRFLLNPMGVMRRVHVARLRVDATRPVTATRERLEIESFSVRLLRAKDAPPFTPSTTPDSAFDDPASPYRRFLDLAVANPAAIDRFRVEPTASDYMAVGDDFVDWRPAASLSDGMPWVKVPVAEEGAYAIDAAWMRRAGLDPATVTPADLYLVSNGYVVPSLALPGAGPGFLEGARLVFYGVGNPSPETSDRYYFVGRRPAAQAPVTMPALALSRPVDSDPLTRHRRTHRLEEDKRLETRVGNFLSIRGMTWVWTPVNTATGAEVEFGVPGLTPEPQTTRAVLRFYYGVARTTVATPVTIAINGQRVHEGRLPAAGFASPEPSIEFDVPPGILKRDANRLRISLGTLTESVSVDAPPIFLDSFDMTYESFFQPANGALELEPAAEADPDDILLSTSGFRRGRLIAFDVTNPALPGLLTIKPADESRDVVEVPGGRTRRLLLIEGDRIALAPDGQPSRLTDFDPATSSADTVLITHHLFREAAELHADDLRRTGQEVVIVDVEDLFERYTGGAVTHSAVRAFLKDMVRLPSGRKPFQVILYGDCSSDGRRIARNKILNYIPTLSFSDPNRREQDQFATDSVYSWLSGDDELADLLVGRISVNSVEAGRTIAEKIRRYRRLPPQEWARRMATVSDYGVFEQHVERMHVDAIGPDFEHRVIRVADFPWEANFYLPRNMLRDEDRKVAPLATAQLGRLFEEGTGVIGFYGHGAPNLWSNQRVWFGGDSLNSDNLLLRNTERPAFVTSMTCNNGAIDYPVERWNVCIAEDMMRVPGGAIGTFMPSGPGFPDQHQLLADGWMRALTTMHVRTMGVVCELARLHYQVRKGSDEHSRMFIYLGEPSLDFPVPAHGLSAEVTLGGSPFLNYPPEGAELDVNVRAERALTTGTATLLTVSGQAAATVTLRTEAGQLRGTIPPVALERRESPLTLSLTAIDDAGTFRVGGARLPLREDMLNIVRIEELPGSPSELQKTVRVSVRNDGDAPARRDLVWVVRNLDDPADRREGRFPFSLQPRQVGHASIELSMPRPGIHSLELRASERFRETLDQLPAPSHRRLLVFASRRGTPQLRSDESLLIGRAASGRGGIFRFFLVNPSTEVAPPENLSIRSRFESGAEIDKAVINVPITQSPPRFVQPLMVESALPREITETVLVEATHHPVWLLQQEVPPQQLGDIRIRPEDLPDLRVVPESVRITPERLSQGVTVIVEGILENAGGAMHAPANLALVNRPGEAPPRPMPNMTETGRVPIPLLPAGARMPFRLRWDPFDESGPRTIYIMADLDENLIESNKGNNAYPIELNIRTTWKLEAGPIAVRQDRPNTLTLVAEVRNTGETDAQRVSVVFFREAQQNAQTRLGEVLLDRVPALGTTSVEYVWDLSREDPTARVRPSFQISLKGSLQRISSATE